MPAESAGIELQRYPRCEKQLTDLERTAGEDAFLQLRSYFAGLRRTNDRVVKRLAATRENDALPLRNALGTRVRRSVPWASPAAPSATSRPSTTAGASEVTGPKTDPSALSRTA
jgi:hypothetical protein